MTTPFDDSPYKDMELSTQLVLHEALNRGHRVEILDREANIISIESSRKVEYIQQATMTSRDRYITPLLMANKAVTKELLSRAGIKVPQGVKYTSIELAQKDYSTWANKGLVIKPNSTNFGTAVQSYPSGASQDEFYASVKEAFSQDQSILIEEFLPWKEYRFLVIGDQTAAVLERIPANVLGNGKATIEELVVQKNLNPLRGKGYVKPLEKINLGQVEKVYLASQGLDIHSVPEKDQQVFLRENSNISTGGDSVDRSDEVHPSYLELARASAALLGAQICGVDLMIKDLHSPMEEHNHGIIELNFNPALHIHSYPAIGKGRAVEKKVLDLLDL